MRGFRRHVRVGAVVILAALLSTLPLDASASTVSALTPAVSPDVFITEVQTNGGSAAQEFIELYNATDQDINFSDPANANNQWKLQFFNAASVKTGAPVWTTAAMPSNAINLSGTISAHDYFILSSTNYSPSGLQPDQFYDAASSHLLTDTGGGLQLLSISGSGTSVASTVHDRLMWLAPAAATLLPAGVYLSPASGKSLQRLPNADGEYVNPDNTLTDFDIEDTISPLAAWQPPAPPLPDPGSEDPGNEGDDLGGGTANNAGLVMPEITELLPNPASPLMDAKDEYIELYNPNATAFNLKGYSLEVGTTTLHDFTFTSDTMLAPKTYQAFYSSLTHLSLANSGSEARLLNNSGETVSETAGYETAPDNAAWALADGFWQWSTTATPNAANTITATTAGTVATKTAPKAATVKAPASKKPTAKAAGKAKGTATTKKAAKTSTKKKPAAKKAVALTTGAATKPKPALHRAILVGVAAAAVLYGLYEYRHDISDKFYQFRNHRSRRRGDRRQVAWR